MTQRVVRNLVTGGVAIGILSICVAMYGQKVSKALHPNLAAAQTFIEKAKDKLTAAQVANEYDMGGHAAKAKALLDQAYAEVKLAALAANK
jgi:uncharacterized protein YqfA (UPF0365 family)